MLNPSDKAGNFSTFINQGTVSANFLVAKIESPEFVGAPVGSGGDVVGD
jgi:hypothetical protein